MDAFSNTAILNQLEDLFEVENIFGEQTETLQLKSIRQPYLSDSKSLDDILYANVRSWALSNQIVVENQDTIYSYSQNYPTDYLIVLNNNKTRSEKRRIKLQEVLSHEIAKHKAISELSTQEREAIQKLCRFSNSSNSFEEGVYQHLTLNKKFQESLKPLIDEWNKYSGVIRLFCASHESIPQFQRLSQVNAYSESMLKVNLQRAYRSDLEYSSDLIFTHRSTGGIEWDQSAKTMAIEGSGNSRKSDSILLIQAKKVDPQLIEEKKELVKELYRNYLGTDINSRIQQAEEFIKETMFLEQTRSGPRDKIADYLQNESSYLQVSLLSPHSNLSSQFSELKEQKPNYGPIPREEILSNYQGKDLDDEVHIFQSFDISELDKKRVARLLAEVPRYIISSDQGTALFEYGVKK